MTDRRLIGKRVVEVVPERELVLEYFMLQNFDEESQTVSYGAQIRKTEGKEQELETVEGITQSEEVIEDIISLLMKHSVTPISMVNIIDDYITEKVCS